MESLDGTSTPAHRHSAALAGQRHGRSVARSPALTLSLQHLQGGLGPSSRLPLGFGQQLALLLQPLLPLLLLLLLLLLALLLQTLLGGGDEREVKGQRRGGRRR